MKNIAGNIFLIGLMGAGKTTLGKQIARQLGREFYDSDHEICTRTGVSVPTIFELEGEQGFRERESAVIDELSSRSNIVLATGGGAVINQSIHAIDLLQWLMKKKCMKIQSFGSLQYFRRENAPADAPERCIDGGAKRIDVIDTFRFNEANEVIEMRAYWGPTNMHGF